MKSQRKDALRNRGWIIDAARDLAARGEPLLFNAVAHAADVGVGTVYRHFASVEALEETVVADRFDELGEILRQTTPTQIGRVLEAYYDLLVGDRLFERVTFRAEPALETTVRHRSALLASLSALVDRGKAEGTLRADLEALDLLALLCGLAHTARTLGVTADSARGRRLFATLMDGLLERGQPSHGELQAVEPSQLSRRRGRVRDPA